MHGNLLREYLLKMAKSKKKKTLPVNPSPTELEKFEADIQEILDKHQFAGETRRQIFSRIMEAALASKKEEAGGSQNEQDQQ